MLTTKFEATQGTISKCSPQVLFRWDDLLSRLTRDDVKRWLEAALHQQEIGRELNTIASKSQDAGVAGLVIDAKAELERMREQAQNVE